MSAPNSRTVFQIQPFPGDCVANQLQRFVRERDRPIVVECLGEIAVDEPGEYRRSGRVKPIVVSTLALANIEDGISPHVGLIEALSATRFAFEAKPNKERSRR